MGLTGRASAARNCNSPPGSVAQPPNPGPMAGWVLAVGCQARSDTQPDLCPSGRLRHRRFQPRLAAVPSSAAALVQPRKTGRRFFFVTISPSPPASLPTFPPAVGSCLLMLGLFPLAQDRGCVDPRAPLLGPLMRCSGSIPKFPSLWSCPLHLGAPGLFRVSLSLVSLGSLGQWRPWWAERSRCSPRLLWGGFHIPAPAPPGPAFPLQHPGGQRTGQALRCCGCGGEQRDRPREPPHQPLAAFQAPGQGRAPGRGQPPAPFGATGSCGRGRATESVSGDFSFSGSFPRCLLLCIDID